MRGPLVGFLVKLNRDNITMKDCNEINIPKHREASFVSVLVTPGVYMAKVDSVWKHPTNTLMSRIRICNLEI